MAYLLAVLPILNVYARIPGQKGTGFRVRIRNTEMKKTEVFLTQKLLLSSWNYDPGCLSLIRIFAIPVPGSRGQKRHWIPGSGSASQKGVTKQ
jgi:hypothetical protein